jgi:hypothetical protein
MGSLKKALKLNETGVWGVDCIITFNSLKSSLARSVDEQDSKEDFSGLEDFNLNSSNKENEVIVYEWDLEVSFEVIQSHLLLFILTKHTDYPY